MKYLILSPSSCQAKAIARYIRLYNNNAVLFGGILLNEPKPKKKKFFDHYVRITDKTECLNYDYVLPTNSFSTRIYTEWMHEFKVGQVYFNEDSLRVNNKPWLFSEAQSINIPIPITWSSYSEIPENANGIFLKPKYEGKKAVRTWVKSKKKVPSRLRNNDLLFQEKIYGKDVFGFGFIASYGDIKVSLTYREVCSEPKDGGNAVLITAYKSERIKELSERLIKHINYNGWGLVEWKYCNKRSDFVLMEINAKCWASIEFSIRNEKEFINHLFNLAGHNEDIKSMIWPKRFMGTFFSNFMVVFKTVINNKPKLGIDDMRLQSVFSDLLPILWKDRIRYFSYKRST